MFAKVEKRSPDGTVKGVAVEAMTLSYMPANQVRALFGADDIQATYHIGPHFETREEAAAYDF